MPKISMFKPMLAPNEEPNLDEVQYPILASYKLDGIRCIFKGGEMLSRSLKPIQNKQLREKFAPLAEYSKIHNVILDGEIYSPKLTFQEITRYVMTQDFEDKKSIKKFGKVLEIPESLKFYCFDAINNNNYEDSFVNRQLTVVCLLYNKLDNLVEVIRQKNVTSKEEVQNYFEEALSSGFEGLILKDHNGKYKCGRGTLNEGLIYKVKPYRTFDAEVIGIIQATKVDPDAEKKTNELGYSVTSKKKDDRVLIEKACDFVVKYDDKTLKVVIAMTDEEKEEIWRNKESYIGKRIFNIRGC